MSPRLQETLNAQKALIFRITHRKNLPWLLQNGLHSRSAENLDPHFVSVGNQELIARRGRRIVPIPPRGTLADYIPFYFTPYSPMLFNLCTGYGGMQQQEKADIVILVSSLHRIHEEGIPFVFTDRHAYLQTARFYADLEELNQIPWELLQQRDFHRDPEEPEKFERYQAEALIYRHLPTTSLFGVGCYNEGVRHSVADEARSCGLEFKVVTRPGWYFS